MQEYLIYLRKSRQDNENETVEEVLARHERQLQEYAIKEFGYKIDEKNIYREIVSGETIDDRPQINLLFERMQSENITGVLVIETSRLTRGDLLDCGRVVHLFKYTNTLIITPQKTYNLDDKFDRKFFEMELTKGNDYLEYTKEILARGRDASIKEGNYLGSIAPYGYKLARIDKSPTLEIDETEAKYVRLAFELYASGMGANSIANRLNELGAKPRKAERFISTSIRQMLENPVYIGKVKYKFKPQKKVYEDNKLVKKRTRNYDCELIEGKHEAIISEELFNKCKIQKGKVTREKPSTELINIFASILKCKQCGRAIGLRPYNQACNGRIRKNRYYCTSGKYCSCGSANVDAVNEAIINALKDYLNDFKVKMNNNTNDTVKTLETLQNSLKLDLKKLDNKQNDLYDLLENGIYTKEVFLMRNEILKKERARIEQAINDIVIPQTINYEEKIVSLHQAIEIIKDDNISPKIKNNFLKEVIEVIYYDKVGNDKQHQSKIDLEVILK